MSTEPRHAFFQRWPLELAAIFLALIREPDPGREVRELRRRCAVMV